MISKHMQNQLRHLFTAIYAYDLEDIAAGPVFSYDMENTFPNVGGGIIDQSNHLWFTTENYVVRLSEELDDPIFSQPMGLPTSDSDSSHRDLVYNGLTLLPTGDLLATTNGPLASIVSTRPTQGYLPVISNLDLRLLVREAGVNIAQEEWDPRPVVDAEGGIYMASTHHIYKFNYLSGSSTLELDWHYERELGPERDFTRGSPVLVAGRICIKSEPYYSGGQLDILCLDTETGETREVLTPSLIATGGSSSCHQLAASKSHNSLIVYTGGYHPASGIAVYDLDRGEMAWSKPMKGLVSSIAIAEHAGIIYLAARPLQNRTLRIMAVPIDGSEVSVLHSLNVLKHTDNTKAGLPALDDEGRLFFPTVDGFVQLSDG